MGEPLGPALIRKYMIAVLSAEITGPEGQMIVAQRFIAGSDAETSRVPEGRLIIAPAFTSLDSG